MPWAFVVLLVVIVGRLLWVQYVDGPNHLDTAKNLYTADREVPAMRGTIYDRNGNVLAMSVECKNIVCDPTLVTDKVNVATYLADKLGGDATAYYEKLNASGRYALLESKVDKTLTSQVLEGLTEMGIKGFATESAVKRVYPYGATGSQVLGLLGTDGNALSGIELQYDDILSGTPGTMYAEVGADGTPVAGGAYNLTDPVNGTDITLSIDINVQQKAEEQLTQAVEDSEAKTGSVVVCDPTTGEILAACSTPTFDVQDSSTVTNESLKLASVSDSFEPGSTFKILTMAIGYDTGTISSSSTFSVPAKVRVGDDLVGDDDGRDYTMSMTPYEIMRRSSNAGAAMVGMAIGADKFAAGVSKFGIGQTTGIDFPGEAAGIVTSRESYTGATVGAMAFGQAVAFPSIQLVRAVSAIANKGVLTTPHLLIKKGDETVEWAQGERAVSEEAARAVTQDMVGVVDEGTGVKAQVEGYTVAGKTGTGEQATSEGGYEGGGLMSSFVGFANADDAKVLCYVGLNGTAQHGGTSAAPAFSAIMGEALVDLGVKGN